MQGEKIFNGNFFWNLEKSTNFQETFLALIERKDPFVRIKKYRNLRTL